MLFTSQLIQSRVVALEEHFLVKEGIVLEKSNELGVTREELDEKLNMLSAGIKYLNDNLAKVKEKEELDERNKI